VKCRHCALEINFNDYTYTQKEAPRLQKQTAIAKAPQPKVDKLPAEWLDPKFHDAECFGFPKHSGFIDETLFWYMREYLHDDRIPQSSPKHDQDMAQWEILPKSEDRQKDPPYYLQAISDRSGIKFIYVNRAYVPPNRSLKLCCEELMEEAARFNLQRLIGGRVKAEFEAKGLEEIEAQLALVPRETAKTRQPRAIFAHLERWKAAREQKKPRRRSAVAQATV
jgi:hypothetical protein